MGAPPRIRCETASVGESPLGEAIRKVRAGPTPEQVVAGIDAMRSPEARVRTPIAESLLELVKRVELNRDMLDGGKVTREDYDESVRFGIERAINEIVSAIERARPAAQAMTPEPALSTTLTWVSALKQAARWFREYEKIHMDKCREEEREGRMGHSLAAANKAARNRERAEFLEASLDCAVPSGAMTSEPPGQNAIKGDD